MTPPLQTGVSSRREAIFVLARWLETDDFPDRLLSDSPDRGFIMDLVYGTVRWRRALEWVLSTLVQRLPEGETRAALLAGAYQILFMDTVPDYAAVNATVAAAKLANARAAGFVNGVLRNLARRREACLAALAQQPPGVRFSHPDALVARWTARYGAADTEALCHWNNTPAQTVIAWLPGADPDVQNSGFRVQQAQVSATEHRTLNTEHASLMPHPAAPETHFLVPHGVRIESLPGYAEGWFVVQDPATAAAVDLLDVHPGQTVLDACAAPGGKTAQLAARMRGQGRLVAMDLHADRLVTLRATLERTRQSWVETALDDATAPADATRFDRILLDVPCSNTGVLRRRPDARWRFAERRLKKLCAVQQAILVRALRRLAPGGRLVYATCSLEPEENLRQVEQALATEPRARLAATVERLPFRDGTDGAFAAAIEVES